MSSKSYPKADQLQIKGNKVFSVVRKTWIILTPEEKVRQDYLRILVNEYGYSIDQLAEEIDVTGRGSAQARADFVIWKSVNDKLDGNSPLIIVECKADNVTIKPADYGQGDNYARLSGASFFVTHNSKETKYWRVVHGKMPKTLEEIENIPHADATDKEIQELLKKLKVFKENEFADLLHQCHNVIRNREKKDPAAAFDEIAKILFIKVAIERRLRAGRNRQNLFNAAFLDQQGQIHDNPIDVLFGQTKKEYKADRIFEEDERVNLKQATVREIVKLLEKYNLSDTSEDIKGIAFERFLGRTFRGEIGQFFTPRTIVEFMVQMLDPNEGDVICDPASGSGGFLIRFFEIVREQIMADVDRQYQKFKTEIDKKALSAPRRAEMLTVKYEELQETIDSNRKGSRMWKLANQCIFGCDANDRMARTSKMNMIMHGDGHGGVHHHDGFINVNGIFEGRFDIVLTNPPFGASVEESDVVLESDVTVSEEMEERYEKEFGKIYTDAMARARAAKGESIASLFELPKSGRVKTEILFIERCLSLLKPGGRLGIVLPEGIYNNPSLAYVREYVEDRAFIRAVVSLPQETFLSSGASVKASLLFLQKFTEKEQREFDRRKKRAQEEIEALYLPEIADRRADFEAKIESAKDDKEKAVELRKALRLYEREMQSTITLEARALVKERFDYEIFLYEADKVGITATGEDDQNELYSNENMPSGVERTAVDLYREFRRKPKSFLRESAA
ncbi:MAG: N-6 DNA methylase [Pyrinomonadaceae bacterium]